MTLQKATDAIAGLFLLNVYPHEMREYLLEEHVIRAIDDSKKDFPHKSEVVKEILLSHPFVLPSEIPSRGWVGPIIAQTKLLAFEFPRQLGPKDQTEKLGYFDSLWEERTF
ncbi:MAG: hypothetical protein ABSD49_13525 [Candidatus Bathyarchaeia archaeon]|jgi:hypothetical protein